MLNYSVTENPLVPNAHIGVPHNVRSYGMDEIYQRIKDREPGINASQVKASFEEITKEVCIIIEDGGAVNTPLFNTYPSIVGGFKSATDAFNTKNNSVKTNVSAGKQVRNATKGIKTQKVQTVGTIPCIVEVTDESKSVNDIITIGGMIQIVGHRLKLAAENPDNGVFLTNVQTGATEKAKRIMKNMPKELIVKMPTNLEPDGVYKLEVRTSFINSAKETKSLKTGHFDRELTACIDVDIDDNDDSNDSNDSNE